jgi:excisionase family DNA binding protein
MLPKVTAARLLTTDEIARVLKVHPKHVYRLLRKGLPARRVGSEWRFDRDEVLAWSRPGSPPSPALPPGAPEAPERGYSLPPIVAANGDRVVSLLLGLLREAGTVIGFVQADRAQALDLLAAGHVLAAGSHAGGFPTHIGEARLARIHLVTREVGLASRAASVRLRDLAKLRLASRPATAGIRQYLDEALARESLDPAAVNRRALSCASHAEVVCAVARGAADVGVASRAWAEAVGLSFRPLAREPYGLLVRARELGDSRIVRMCEVTQGDRFRAQVSAMPGYDATGAGDIRYDGIS